MIRSFRVEDTDDAVRLWTDCGLVRPWNDPRRDIERKLAAQPELFLVGELDGELVATAMVGYDGHRGWINYLAVDPAQQRRSFGRAMMAEAERLLAERGCPKVNMQIRAGNEKVIGFYRGLGYGEEQAVTLGKRLGLD